MIGEGRTLKCKFCIN